MLETQGKEALKGTARDTGVRHKRMLYLLGMGIITTGYIYSLKWQPSGLKAAYLIHASDHPGNDLTLAPSLNALPSMLGYLESGGLSRTMKWVPG